MKKKVTFVIPSIGFGGAEIQTINQLTALQGLGYDCFLIIIDDIYALRDQITVPDSSILLLKHGFNTLTVNSILNSGKIIKRINNFLIQNKIDVVIANLPYAHFIMRLVRFSSKAIRKQICLINYHHSIQYHESPLDTFPKKAFNSLNSVLARYADNANIFISDASFESSNKNFFVKNPVVINNAVPEIHVDGSLALEYLNSYGITKKLFLIVIPGRINEAKGQMFFANSFKDFVHKNNLNSDEIFVIVAGGGNLEQAFTEKLTKLQIDRYFHITGFVDNNLLLSFLALANLVVIPSIFEGFGNVAVESLMQNALILSSDSGGLKEIIINNENGFIFQSGNSENFLEKLNYIYYNFEKGLISKEKIQESFLKRFSYNIHINNLINVIDSCAV